MKSLNYQTYYFVGIGGIGMSALARFVLMQGKTVYGFDASATALTQELEDMGMKIQYDENTEIAKSLNPTDTMVVYTPAIPVENKVLAYFKAENFKCLKRAEFLGYITKPTQCLAVAGTHGKTTTSSILAHLLVVANKPVSAFLGGITENYKSNFIYKGDEITVVEADEYDRSFLQLQPSIACINNTDADHLDIYESKEAMQEAFQDFAALVSDKKKLVHPLELKFGGTSVGLNNEANYSAQNIEVKNGAYVFDLKTPEALITGFEFSMPGNHNLLNAVTALCMALKVDAKPEALKEGLRSFKGIDRRFSLRYRDENKTIIEDYAHHPVELTALSNAARTMYEGKKIALVFQPHLYSRTQDFGNEFAESLTLFDELYLLDIFPARELPIEGITSDWLLSKVKHQSKTKIEKSEIKKIYSQSQADVFVFAGAGDITKEVADLVKELEDEK